METWLVDHLIRTGHMTESGLTRTMKLRTCRRKCGARVLVGLDADLCAFEAFADPTPLSPLGEALALLEDRRTYDLTRNARGWLLDVRDAGNIEYHPAGSQPRCDVLREHRCHTPPPADALATSSSFVETAPPVPAGSSAPF